MYWYVEVFTQRAPVRKDTGVHISTGKKDTSRKGIIQKLLIQACVVRIHTYWYKNVSYIEELIQKSTGFKKYWYKLENVGSGQNMY